MAVGNQGTEIAVNNSLSSLALQMRELMTQVRQFDQYISYLNGLSPNGLVALGFSAADAASVVQLAGYMNSISAVYFGTGTQPAASNFDAALVVLWAGN